MSATLTLRAVAAARLRRRPCAALDAGRLGARRCCSAGPAQLGKRAVAERLAQRLLCQQPRRRRRAVRHAAAAATCSRPARIRTTSSSSFIPNKEGTRLRTEIVIEQIRELSEQLSLTPQYGGAQVVIIDPADAINHAACNALLKTLEEPVPGRYLWLVSAHPGAPAGDDPQPLPAARIPPAAGATKRWPG